MIPHLITNFSPKAELPHMATEQWRRSPTRLFRRPHSSTGNETFLEESRLTKSPQTRGAYSLRFASWKTEHLRILNDFLHGCRRVYNSHSKSRLSQLLSLAAGTCHSLKRFPVPIPIPGDRTQNLTPLLLSLLLQSFVQGCFEDRHCISCQRELDSIAIYLW